MKQTLDNLSRWSEKVRIRWTDNDANIFYKVLYQGQINGTKLFDYSAVLQDGRDAAFMAALTSKKGLPYIAKLTALKMEEQ